MCSIAVLFGNANWHSSEECCINVWNVPEHCSKVPPTEDQILVRYARTNCIWYNEVLTCSSELARHRSVGACAAPHTLCASTCQSNSMMTASVIYFSICMPLVFYTVFKWIIFFCPTAIYLDHTVLLKWMAYFYTTNLTTSVIITTTKHVFIRTCTCNVGLTVLLLMQWHPC